MAWIGGLIGGALSLIGSSNSADAATQAAQTQSASGDRAIAETQRQYDQTRADTQGYRDSGNMANMRLRRLLGLEGGADSGTLSSTFNANDLATDPVYQNGLKFGLDEGTKGINARAIGSGMYDSGATLRALTKFGNDYGTTKANEAFNRFNVNKGNIYNQLAGLSGTGQTAVGQVNAAGQNSSNNVSNLLTGQGNAQAAGIVGGANAWGSGAQSVNNAWNNYQSNQTLQKLLSRNSSTPSAGSGNESDNWY